MALISKSKNTIACIVATVISIIVTLRIGNKFIPQIPILVLAVLVIMVVLGVIIFWRLKNRAGNRENSYAFWHNVTRFFLAMDMITFALEKVFHLQFVIPLGVLDNPFSSLNGEQLIWAFFGKYYAFTVIIASLQMLSAILLLFRRTWLFGIILLLPVLCNILLLDWVYDLAILVNIYITLLTLAAVYLLFSEYQRLKEFFFISRSDLPQFTLKNKIIWRLSVIVIPIILMAFYRFPATHPEIFGKYQVDAYLIDNTPANLSACRDSMLTKVFIDNSDFVMEYGGYQNRWIGHYTFNNKSGNIKVIWRYPADLKDTLYATIGETGKFGNRTLTGRIGKRELKLTIKRIDN